jgi:uncharacterized protein
MSVVIDVRDLTHQPGASRRVRVTESIDGLGTELASVPQDRQIDAELLLESLVDGVLVTGPVSGTMRLTCARCLKPFDQNFRLDVQELFAAGAGTEDDEYPLDDDAIDVEPMIRDAVVPSMPFAPLCRPDCLGLCERCGGDRNLGECTCGPDVDDRWAPLASLDLRQEQRPENGKH